MALEKSKLHPRNRNRERYDLEALLKAYPDLQAYVVANKHGAASIDFSNPIAVKLLNKGLLSHYYGITYWEFPDTNLCPPIPGRADYIHYMADLLKGSNFGRLPSGKQIKCLDIGTGASCIYPIISVVEYGWQCIASDIAPQSIAASKAIIAANPQLQDQITCRLQPKPRQMFSGIIQPHEKIDISICNPPFHASTADAVKGTQRKIKNLTGQRTQKPQLNFSGNANELIYNGGEYQFIKTMIADSVHFSKQCFWFSTLVSKQAHLNKIYKLLKAANVLDIKTIPMGTGNKSTRIVAWTFLNKEAQKVWRKTQWNV